MDDYSVIFTSSARKELEKLTAPLVKRIFNSIEGLAADPRPRGCRKIQGSDDLWRIPVGQYRVIYRVDDNEQIVDVVTMRHRRDAYRY